MDSNSGSRDARAKSRHAEELPMDRSHVPSASARGVRPNRRLRWPAVRGISETVFRVSCFPLVALCLIVAVAGCAGSLGRPRAGPADRALEDPYEKALEKALIRQHLSLVGQGTNSYRIGPNDVVEIRVYEYDRMNTVVRVASNGQIGFPPLGDIEVAGLTERQLESLLNERLRGKYLQDPHVTVFVREPHASVVAVVGEVSKPGRYPLLGEKSLVELLTEAGGMTDKAGNVAYVIRFENGASLALDHPTTAVPGGGLPDDGSGAQSIAIDLDALLLRGEDRWNVRLMPGDLVNIPEAGSVHVTGPGVVKPGTYPLTRSSKTLRQILDEAGGLRFEAQRKMLLVRKGESGREVFVHVDFQQIMRDSRNDMTLRAGDTVITDRTIGKTALALIGRGIARVVHFGLYGTVRVPIAE